MQFLVVKKDQYPKSKTQEIHLKPQVLIDKSISNGCKQYLKH